MSSTSYKKYETKKFYAIVGFKGAEVESIISNIELYYNEWVEKKIDKKTGLPKTYLDGTIKERIIRPSQGKLKIIQSRIKNKILAPIPLPDNVHGGIKKRSNITNAKPHQGKKYIFTTDLQTFFPNISSKKVYDTFIDFGYSTHFSRLLTKLSTWKYELPQGTPTSTHIANLVFLKTDIRLIELCNHHGITYTRFVDDLTFSSQQDFSSLLSHILKIVEEGGFKISHRKTQYKGKQTITGIEVFNHKIDAPKKILEKAKLEIDNHPSFKPYSNYVENIRNTNRKN
ncbi:reverse transcriptase family protein [Flavobacterium sp. RNTU_13]|uniref:reverse transcriptase family protein n=1 Tax=Flavobacterium sp. RNTU_13 TaxID=3375145 RepID=UPI0039865834